MSRQTRTVAYANSLVESVAMCSFYFNQAVNFLTNSFHDLFEFAGDFRTHVMDLIALQHMINGYHQWISSMDMTNGYHQRISSMGSINRQP